MLGTLIQHLLVRLEGGLLFPSLPLPLGRGSVLVLFAFLLNLVREGPFRLFQSKNRHQPLDQLLLVYQIYSLVVRGNQVQAIDYSHMMLDQIL